MPQGYIYDHALVLRDSADGDESDTAAETAIALPMIPFHPDNDNPHNQRATAVINVQKMAMGTSVGATIAIRVDSVVGMSDSPVTIGTITLADGVTGQFIVPLDMIKIHEVDPNAAYIQAVLTVDTAAAFACNYHAFVARAGM